MKKIHWKLRQTGNGLAYTTSNWIFTALPYSALTLRKSRPLIYFDWHESVHRHEIFSDYGDDPAECGLASHLTDSPGGLPYNPDGRGG